MRRTAALLALGLLTALFVVWGPATPAQACSCAGASTTAEHFGRADAVFTGRLVQRSVDSGWLTSSSADPARHVFEVEVVLKGRAHQRQAVYSAASSASCGLALDGEGPFAVFARRDADHLRADLCGGTAELSTRLHAELAALSADGSGRLLPGSSPDDSWWTARGLVGGGAIAVLGAAGLLVIVRRRRRRRPTRA